MNHPMTTTTETQQTWIDAITVFAPDKIRTIEGYDHVKYTYIRTTNGTWREIKREQMP